MAKHDEPSDAQLISRLRRAKSGRTAQQLHTTSSRLRGLDVVVEIGRVRSGKTGRLAVLFALSEQVESGDHDGTDPSAQSRDGSLSQQEV